jgi:ferredoxin
MVYRVIVRPSDTVIVVKEGQTILEAALAAGIDWPYGCAHGMCGACKAHLLAGEVDMGETSSFALFDDERAQGLILTCSARPISDVEVTFDDAKNVPA